MLGGGWERIGSLGSLHLQLTLTALESSVLLVSHCSLCASPASAKSTWVKGPMVCETLSDPWLPGLSLVIPFARSGENRHLRSRLHEAVC